jgi:Fe-S oxidoreductase
MRKLVAKEQALYRISRPKKKVYLFADEFTNLQEAELGLTFAKLLMRLGYKVEIPKHVESGRAAISKGCLKYAKRFAVKNVLLLKDKVSESHPLVGIEPSCILSFRDEYPDLVPSEMRQDALVLAKNCLLYDEFLMKEIAEGNISADDFEDAKVEIWLHGHCHQKALVGVDKTAKALDTLLAGARVNVIPSGCCGMAGSFGYEKEHYKTSIKIGEMILFPTVKKVTEISQLTQKEPVFVAAPGTSCRQQILDGTGVKAVHPIEILYRYIKQK